MSAPGAVEAVLHRVMRTSSAESGAHDVALLALRLMSGMPMLMIYGSQKLPIEGGFLGMVEKMALPMPVLLAWTGALTEVIGGACLIFGLLTRPAALMIGAALTVALVVYHDGHAFEHREKALLYAVQCLAMLLLGPGRVSLDHWWVRRRQTRVTGPSSR